MACTRDVAIQEVISRITPQLVGIPTKYPNGPEPDRPSKTTPWVRVSFRFADSNRASIGVRREKHDAFLYVQYFFPVGSGSTLLYTTPQPMLDTVTDYKSPSGVWFRKVELLEGSDDDAEEVDGYYGMLLRAQFTFDEVREK